MSIFLTRSPPICGERKSGVDWDLDWDFFGRVVRRGTALQIFVHFCFHLSDFVEEILGNLRVVTRQLVLTQCEQRILKRFDTLPCHF